MNTWIPLGTPAADSTGFSDSNGLSAGVTYFYRVRAGNDIGSSANSNVASAIAPSTPAAPSNLVATPLNGSLQINLSWTDNANNETGFIVEQRSPDGTTNWTQVATPAANATSFPDTTGLVAGTTYFYRVRATGTIGNSANSNIASATTPSKPAAPTNLVTTPAAGSVQINLTWTDNANNETGFIVERSPNGNDTWTQVGAPAANATSFSDSTGLVAGTTYYYRVRATNALGDSANASVASATTASTPAAPSTLVATPAAGSLQINLTWVDNSNNETGFIIERSPNGTDTWTQVGMPAANATSFSDSSGLSEGTAYFYRVRATDALGDSANSNVATATTAAKPAAPSNLLATAATGTLEIDLTWTDNSNNETGFIVERSLDGSTNWTQVGTPALNATSFSDTNGLVAGTTYFYRVRATDALGDSANSNVASATAISAPAAPSDLVAVGDSSTQIDLSWTDNSNNETGFIIERSPNGTDTWTLAGTPAANATTFTDTVTPGAPYFYRVRATNNGTDSANSAVAHSWPLAGTPSSPTPNGVAVNALPTVLDWADTVNATSYDVYWNNAFLANVTASQYTGVLPASVDGTQTWYVIAKNADNSDVGPNWSFTLDTTAPTATFGNQTPTPGASTFDFTVAYADATSGVDATTFDNNDITVTGPNSFSANATFISAVGNVATYRITAPGGTWNGTNDGIYTISQNAGQVKDLAGNAVAAGSLGTFTAASFAYMTGGTLNVQFDGTSSPVTLGNSGSTITVSRGSTTLSFDGVTAIQMLGTSGSDTLQINGTITPAVTYTGSSGNAAVHVMSGSVNFAGDLSPSLHNVMVTIDSGAVATFNASQHLAGLSVAGTAVFAAGGNKVLRTSNLSVTGQLNLNDNAMVIDFSAATPYGDIAGMVLNGRNGGTWTGNGIITGMSAAAGSNPLTTLGVANASDAMFIAESAVWDGEVVNASDMLVRYTYLGDANLDGVINGDDYFQIDQGYANQSTGYVHGDFDGNGRIDADDYFIIDSHYNKAQTPLASSQPFVAQSAPAVATPSTANSSTIFSDTSIPSAYERLQETDDLL